MNLLEIEHVVKQYDKHRALDDVSLTVPRGSIYGLLGPNGAGKTTLIRIINGITAPDSGKILLNGEPINSNSTTTIGYLPEERGLYKKMKVGEQALFLAQLKGLSRSKAREELKYWFEHFEIQGWWDKKVEELSKGMAQKVQFIITILHRPQLLILDEPFSGFDPINAEAIRAEILQLNKAGTTIILSTHNMGQVEQLCDEIALINQSRIVLQGNVDEIRKMHATNTFHVQTSCPLHMHHDTIKITSTEKENNYLIVKPEGMSNNALLQELMQQSNIVSFEELLPSMNEIFIKTVTQNLSSI
ncbi:MAG: ATP-binding cassette domain-containing protein [Paludibacteraceae bacterium]|nr:ATP-binding cassette domain-containing protein [Paludibacteraceae bacterium]